jgi:hypothetical protein
MLCSAWPPAWSRPQQMATGQLHMMVLGKKIGMLTSPFPTFIGTLQTPNVLNCRMTAVLAASPMQLAESHPLGKVQIGAEPGTGASDGF